MMIASSTLLTSEERAHRARAVEAAEASLRIEGIQVPPETQHLHEQYIEGLIDDTGILETLNSRYKR